MEVLDTGGRGFEGGLELGEFGFDGCDVAVDAVEFGLRFLQGAPGATGGCTVVEFLGAELVETGAEVFAKFDFEDCLAGFEVGTGGGKVGVSRAKVLDGRAEVFELPFFVSSQSFLEFRGDFGFVSGLLVSESFHSRLDFCTGTVFRVQCVFLILDIITFASEFLKKRAIAVLLLDSLLLELLQIANCTGDFLIFLLQCPLDLRGSCFKGIVFVSPLGHIAHCF